MFRIACASLFATLSALSAAPVATAPYPEKPIRLIIPFSPGGGTDLLSRSIQHRLEQDLGVGVIIDNRTGGGGTIGVTLAARAATRFWSRPQATPSPRVSTRIWPTMR